MLAHLYPIFTSSCFVRILPDQNHHFFHSRLSHCYILILGQKARRRVNTMGQVCQRWKIPKAAQGGKGRGGSKGQLDRVCAFLCKKYPLIFCGRFEMTWKQIGYTKLYNFWDLAFIICLFHKIGCSVISRPPFADSLNFIILENSHHFFGNTKSNVFTAFAILWCLENNKTFEMFFCLNFWVCSILAWILFF